MIFEVSFVVDFPIQHHLDTLENYDPPRWRMQGRGGEKDKQRI